MKSFAVVLMVAMSSLIVGCATSGHHEVTTPVDMPRVAEFDKVNIIVTSQIDSAKPAFQTIENRVASNLKARFAQVQLQDNEKSAGVLDLKLEVTDFNKPNGFFRMMVGSLAGKNRVTVKATLIDHTTQRVVGGFTGTGEHASNAGIEIGDAGTYNAANALGVEVAKYLHVAL